jgi:hypothetical protein
MTLEIKMFAKSLIAAAAVASTVALGTAAPANADPHFGFSIGFGTPGYGFVDPGYGFGDSGFGGPDPFFYRHHHRHHGWGYPAPVSYGMSCGMGANVVRANGFNGVHPVDCSAPVFGYEAWKRGGLYRVGVSMSGRIVAVNPVY